jgi:AAHS family 4-hydroxybenzoate transporter-like MFS transporter
MGRTGAILGSAIGGSFLAWGGPQGFFLALAVPLAGAAIAVLSLRLSPSPANGALAAAH